MKIPKKLKYRLLFVIKKGEVQDLKYFSPISLDRRSYKLLVKVMANMLQKRVRNQKIFMEIRKNLDTILITNETIDLKLKSTTSGVIFKIDIKTMHDHIIWDFSIMVFVKLGFG